MTTNTAAQSTPVRDPGRDLTLDLVRVTEVGALAAGRWIGRGQAESGDEAAARAMRELLTTVPMRGTVVARKRRHQPLAREEAIGNGAEPECDVAVAPIDGLTHLATGTAGSICALAVAERGAMRELQGAAYMHKMVVGPDAVGAIDIHAPIAENIRRVANAKGTEIADLSCSILDRPRHAELVSAVRHAGAIVRLIPDGDLVAAVACARPESDTDILIGIGGALEGVVAAAAIRCMGGEMQAQLVPDLEAIGGSLAGGSAGEVLHASDLVGGDEVHFAATGITGGDLLDGVAYRSAYATTQSIMSRASTGTVRMVRTRKMINSIPIH